jgi:hypothetical protein
MVPVLAKYVVEQTVQGVVLVVYYLYSKRSLTLSTIRIRILAWIRIREKNKIKTVRIRNTTGNIDNST